MKQMHAKIHCHASFQSYLTLVCPYAVDPASIEKIMELDSHIGCAMSGLTADARTLVDKVCHADIAVVGRRLCLCPLCLCFAKAGRESQQPIRVHGGDVRAVMQELFCWLCPSKRQR